MFGSVDQSIYPFAASGDASAASGLSARQLQQVSYSAIVGSGGMGTEGMIYTVSAGVIRRLAIATDTEYHTSWNTTSIWFPTGDNTGFQTDATFAQSMVRNIISFIEPGGLTYSPDGTAANAELLSSQSQFDSSLIA
jgi:carbon starvation protein CstA